MTIQKVLDVFSDYLANDSQAEVVLTSRGYTFLTWDRKQEDWSESHLCSSPEELMDALLDSHDCYEELLLTHGNRDLTQDEREQLEEKRRQLKRRCESI